MVERERDRSGPRNLMAEILHDIFDIWERHNPESERPDSLRQLMRLWARAQRREISQLPQKRIEILARKANARAAEVDRLARIPIERRLQVRLKVKSAYWSVNSQASWIGAFSDFADKNPEVISAIGFIISGAVILPPVLLIFSSINPNTFKGGDFLTLVACGISWALLNDLISTILKQRGPKWLIHAWRLTTLTLAISALAWDGWRASTESRLQDTGLQHHTILFISLRGIHLGIVAILVIKLVALSSSLTMLGRMASALAFKAGPRESAQAVASSKLVLELLQIAILAEKATFIGSEIFDIARSFAEPPSGSLELSHGFRTYVASKERKEIIDHLEQFARIADGHWRRSLKTGDHLADAAVTTLCDGISTAARRWKGVAATATRSQLDEMREAYATALVDACSGNWSKLAVEVSARELIGRRILAWTRHLLAFVIMASSVILMAVQPGKWPATAKNPLIESIILAFAGAVCLSIDPSLGERVGNAGRLMGQFTSKR